MMETEYALVLLRPSRRGEQFLEELNSGAKCLCVEHDAHDVAPALPRGSRSRRGGVERARRVRRAVAAARWALAADDLLGALDVVSVRERPLDSGRCAGRRPWDATRACWTSELAVLMEDVKRERPRRAGWQMLKFFYKSISDCADDTSAADRRRADRGRHPHRELRRRAAPLPCEVSSLAIAAL
ncbi:MAG: hypothetical protein ACLSVD_04725 [Eggerthellaceae bacterium]